MRIAIWISLIILYTPLKAQYSEKQQGTVVANGEKFEGLIAINLKGNTVILDEGSQNRMFHDGIERVIIGTQKDTYVTAALEGDQALFRMVVEGKTPLLERFGYYFSYVDKNLIQLGIDEKQFYAVFGKDKKDIKDYAFVRNLSIVEESSIINIFKYYNTDYTE